MVDALLCLGVDKILLNFMTFCMLQSVNAITPPSVHHSFQRTKHLLLSLLHMETLVPMDQATYFGTRTQMKPQVIQSMTHGISKTKTTTALHTPALTLHHDPDYCSNDDSYICYTSPIDASELFEIKNHSCMKVK